ncbi:unnamed protein product [Caenorhabditis auriculariae]|uniref:RNA-directed DNA polymerase n=1 Tax=Caenorhabditis auriculariae TaxID=2777116 RepID=A0A8S1GTB7_9PELO|nr:unnamed protein product [Caenorhabditis auriculariae]
MKNEKKESEDSRTFTLRFAFRRCCPCRDISPVCRNLSTTTASSAKLLLNKFPLRTVPSKQQASPRTRAQHLARKVPAAPTKAKATQTARAQNTAQKATTARPKSKAPPKTRAQIIAHKVTATKPKPTARLLRLLGRNSQKTMQNAIDALTAQVAKMGVQNRPSWPIFAPEHESFPTFIRRVNDYCNAQQLTDEDARRAFPTMLRGELRELLEDIPSSQRSQWQTLIDAFKGAYHTKARSQEALSALTAASQNHRPIDEFATTIRELAMGAYPGNADARDAAALAAFMAGLEPKLRKKVRRAEPQSFTYAVNRAKREEALLRIDAREEQIATTAEVVHAVMEGRAAQRQFPNWNNSPQRASRPFNRPDRNNRPRFFKKGRRDQDSPNRRNNDYQDDNRRSEPRNQQRRSGPNNQHPRRPWQRRPQHVNAIQPWFLATVCALLTIGTMASPTFYDCTPRGGVLVAPPQLENCEVDTEHPTQARVTLYVRNHSLTEITAFRCTIEEYQRCVRTRVWFPEYNQTLKTITAMPSEHCLTATKEHTIEGRTFRKTNVDTWTSEPTEYPTRPFWGDNCITVKRLVLTRGIATSIAKDKLITNLLLNTEACSIFDGLCTNDVATVVWEAPKNIHPECAFIKLGQFDSLVGTDRVAIEAMQSTLIVDDHETELEIQQCFKDSILVSTSGTIIQFPEFPKATRLADITRRPRSKRDSGSIIETSDVPLNALIIATNLRSSLLPSNRSLTQSEKLQATHVSPRTIARLLYDWRISYQEVLDRMVRHRYNNASLAILHTVAAKELALATMNRIRKQEEIVLDSLLRQHDPYKNGVNIPDRSAKISIAYHIALGPDESNLEKALLHHYGLPPTPNMTEAQRDRIIDHARDIYENLLRPDTPTKQIPKTTPTTISPTIRQTTTMTSKAPSIREVRQQHLLDQPTPLPPVVGSDAQLALMKSTYDFEEDTRRNLTDTGLNAKLQFTADSLAQSMKTNFQTLLQSLCRNNNKQLQLWLGLLQLDPTVGVRSLLGRVDIAAHFVGNGVVAVTKCQPVYAKKIFYSKRVNNTCYSETPVLTEQNELAFIVAGSRDLLYRSAKIPCPAASLHVWNENGTWWTDTGKANVTQLPNWHEKGHAQMTPIVFQAADLYGPAKGSAFPFMMAMSFGTNLAYLQQNQARLVNVLHGTRLIDRASLRDIATAGGYIVNTTTGAIEDIMENLEDWYMKYVFYVGIPIAAAMIFAALTYCACKLCIFRSVTASLPINAVELQDLPTIDGEERNDEEEEEAEIAYYRSHQRKLLPRLMTYVPIAIPLVCTLALDTVNATTMLERPQTTLPYVAITLASRGLVALWDTGATISYIPQSTLHYTDSHMEKTSLRSAQTANGSKFSFLGKVNLRVGIGKHTIQHTFLVSDNETCPAPALIGYDLMTALDEQGVPTVLHPSEGTLEVGNTTVRLLQQGESPFATTSKKINVIGAANVVIPANTTRRVHLDLTNDSVNEDQLLLLRAPVNGDITFMNTITSPGIMTIRISNVSDNSYEIQKGTTLGQACVLRIPEQPRTFPPIPVEQYTPPEADWESKLPSLPKDLLKELNLQRCALDEAQQKELRKIILDHRSAFFNDDGNIGMFTGPIQHRIDIRDDLPFPKPRTYRTPLGKRDEVERQVQELLAQGIIEPSLSTFTSPVVLVKKKDSTWRFTVDYRQLNAVTKKQVYLIPTVSEIVDLAAGAKFFTNLDLISGFFQLPLREEDRPLTAFTTPSGTYQFRRMPMGLCGAPHTFQSAVQYLQKQLPRGKLFVYLDDLLLTSETAEDHLEDIKALLNTTARLGFKVRLSKCHFAQEDVTFLGLRIGREGVAPNPKKVEALNQFPQPRSPTAVRSFLGMCNYFRRFVKDFASLAAPLHNLTKEDTEFNWTPEHEKSFNELKSRLTTAPILAGPTPGQPYQIESDASSIAIGAVLLQAKNPGEPLHAIAYASRKLRAAERNYAAIETEALALVFALNEFRTYVLGCPITAIVDHRPLTSLMVRKDLVGRLAKFQLIIAEYDIQITYRPGSKNVVPDALSRYIEDEARDPIIKTAKKATVAHLHDTSTLDVDSFRKIQNETKWIRDAISELSTGNSASKNEANKRYVLYNDMLYAKPRSAAHPPLLILPRADAITKSIIQEVHNDPITGAHLGATKTAQAIKRRLVWTNIDDDVRLFVAQCTKCQKRKPNAWQATREPLGSLPIGDAPGQRWHIDVLGPLPITARQNRYILTMVDAFSKLLITVPINTQETTVIVRAILDNLVTKHGTPQCIVTDNGSNFQSKSFKDTINTLGMTHISTAPYHKNSNGQVERYHRTLEESLAAFVNDTQSDWDDYLSLITFALNTTPHTTTGLSPFFVTHGREPRIPADVLWKSPMPVYINEEDHATMLRIQLAELWKFTRERLRVGQARQKKNYEKTHRIAERKICTGDLVLVKRAPAKNKLAPYLHGPYTVISVSGPNIQYAQDNRIAKAHKNDVRLFKRNHITDAQQTEELQDYPEDDTIAEAQEQPREAQQPAPQRPQRLRKPPKRLQH